MVAYEACHGTTGASYCMVLSFLSSRALEYASYSALFRESVVIGHTTRDVNFGALFAYR